MDEKTLHALAEAGSTLSQPHLLEHHFICSSRAAAEPVVAWARTAKYQPSAVSEDEYEGSRRVTFDLVKSTVPTIENITVETTLMLEVAARFGIEYDGWGCLVVR